MILLKKCQMVLSSRKSLQLDTANINHRTPLNQYCPSISKHTTDRYFLYRTCKAINIHDIDIKGLNLSPIRLSFQQNPENPFLLISGWPGTCSMPLSKIDGFISRRYAVVQIDSSVTVIKLEKLKIALILWAY
mmetsp:Transcript_12146/g.18447  ORF Transcript_12146/g.18447 Transcript_12146/m.18447 type:complete len:133 (+) Transcript_12146:72-470(+)